MKNFRVAHILFVLLGILFLTAVSTSTNFLPPKAYAQIGVTPTLYCLSAGCPTLSPVKSAPIRGANNAQDISTVPSPIVTVNTTTPLISTQPCSDSLLSSFTSTQTPAQSQANSRRQGGKFSGQNGRFGNTYGNGSNRPGRGGRGGGSGGYGGDSTDNRGGFLSDFFDFFLTLINLLVTMTGTGGSLPCAPSLSGVPAVSNTPSLNPVISAALIPTVASNPASPSGPSPSIPTQQSDNWAGYVINTPVTNHTSITTQWTATKIDCSKGDGHASSWPGMGGWGNSDASIAQLGTAEVCNNGSSTYYGWTESYPNPVVPLDATTHAVKIGDQFSGTVTFTGNGSFTTIMTDKTQGWTENMPITINGFTPTTSEIITESSSDYPIVPKFDPISYLGNIYSQNGTTQTPLSAAPKLVKITNTNDKGLLRTDTSPINGTSFTTTWTHN